MNSQTLADSWNYGMPERSRETSPRLIARLVGVFYLLAVLTAVSAEFFFPGRLGLAAVLIPISCSAAVTLLLYCILKPVNRSLSLLAMFFNLVGLGFEAFNFHYRGIPIGMMFHGLYCLLAGYLIFKSTFLPRILGALMAFAGLVWLIYLLPSFAKYLSPYDTAFGLLAEALPMLWLLVMGVNVQRWRNMTSASEERQ